MWAKTKALHGHHDKEMIKDPPEHFNRRTLIVAKGSFEKVTTSMLMVMDVVCRVCGLFGYLGISLYLREPCRFRLTLCILNVKVLDLIIFLIIASDS